MKKLALVSIAALSLAGCAETVDSGNRGIEKRFGEVTATSLQPGLHWYNPMTTDIIEMNAQVLKWVGATETYTQDIQQADVTFTITYRLNPNKVHIVYQQVGTQWAERLIPQVVTQALKDEFGRWGAVAVIANRSKLQSNIIRRIRPRLAAGNVELVGFELTDISYSEVFNNAVEAKETAVQRAIEEQNKTKQIEEQGKQKIISAKAEAESIQLRSNALQSNPKLVEWEAVQKWDGKLPRNMYGGGAMPFINVK